jgi:multiple sugar transport system substrate-binding protein
MGLPTFSFLLTDRFFAISMGGKSMKWLLILTTFMSLTIVPVIVFSKDKPYTGINIRVLTQESGTFIAGPLKKRGKEFEELTGAHVEVMTVPFGELYDEIHMDFGTKRNLYSAIVFAPQWIVDFVRQGYLEDLTDLVQNDTQIEWKDVAPFFRNFSTKYNDRIYTIPLDGDFHMVYYRTDILEQNGLLPPATWQDYLEVASKLNGKDMNGDDIPDYGSCISKKVNEQAYWMFMSIAASIIQSKGTSQGVFFDTDTMEPLVNNEAFFEALRLYMETSKHGPPDELQIDTNDLRNLFISGRCALAIDWGDIGTMAHLAESKVKDKVGAVIVPGSTHVLDRKTGKLVKCDTEVCPYAINGINFAPYAAFGGWSGAINAAISEKEKEAAYAYLSFVSSPVQSNVDVTIGATGFNPYRISQFRRKNLWLKSGMSKNAVRYYLGAIGRSLNSPNMVLDLRIPSNRRYQGEVLDIQLNRFLTGKANAVETMEIIEKEWNRITDELGRKKQLSAYKASIGMK